MTDPKISQVYTKMRIGTMEIIFHPVTGEVTYSPGPFKKLYYRWLAKRIEKNESLD